jgi:hypothetical protein
MLLELPRERTWKMAPIKRMEEFDPVFFQETFRFSQGEFTEILSSMRDLDGDLLVDVNGNPRLLRRIGKTPQEYMRCWSDSALMILLRRLSRPSSWVTLQGELGGSRAALSRIFTHMVDLVWTRYGSLVSDISVWKSFFPDFATHLKELGAPFDNLIGFVDGKLVPTARTGGNGCVFLNLHDFQTYSGLHRGAAPVRVSLVEGAKDIPGCSAKVLPASEYPAALVGVAPMLKRVEVTSRDP